MGERALARGAATRVVRAPILAKPLIAFLDEATSALDESNERLLYEHLHSLGLTYVSISHRNTWGVPRSANTSPNGRVELLRLPPDQRGGGASLALMEKAFALGESRLKYRQYGT